MKRLFIFLLLCSCVFATPQEGWHSLYSGSSDSTVYVNLLHSDSNYVEIEYFIPGYFIENETVGGTAYSHLSLKNRDKTTDSTGLPRLPILPEKIAIPECDSITITVSYFNPDTVTSIEVYPVPQIINDSIGYDEEFYMDSSFYENQSVYPTDDYDSETSKMRRQNISSIELYPFVYDVSQNRLRVFAHINIRLDFHNPQSSICMDAGPMNNICRSILLNSAHLPRLAAIFVLV